MTPTLPDHIAIIMDGNGRWASDRGLPKVHGHRAGARSLRRIIEECDRLDVSYITVFAFSTENWSRPPDEVDALMALMAEFSRSEADDLRNQGVRVIPMGSIDELPAMARMGLRSLAELTASGEGLTLLLAVNYGGRSDLARAARRLAEECLKGHVRPEEIDGRVLGEYLLSYPHPDPDLIIRTGGEWRLSNFYLFQAAYAEFFSSPVYWPDFGPEHLAAALQAYAGRQRRFGGRPTDDSEGG